MFGLAQIVLSSCFLCTALYSLGLNAVAVKFFPIFSQEKDGASTLLRFLLAGAVLGCLLFVLSMPLLKKLLVNVLFESNPRVSLLEANFIYILPLVFLMIFSSILLRYISNFRRIVVPLILDQLLIKLVLPSLVLLFAFGYIDESMFFYGLIGNYILELVGLFFYLRHLGYLNIQFNKQLFSPSMRAELRSFSGYSVLNTLSSQLAFRIDTLMVGGIISISSGGIYAISNLITETISKPAKALHAISSPIISDNWNKKNTHEIEAIYKKSSDLLLIAGLFISIGIWLSIDDLFSLMPDSELMRQGKYVILLLAIAKLVDLSTSVNTPIIVNSAHYRFNFYALVSLAVINIGLNIILIPKHQMIGAAFATLISQTLFNVAKALFIKWKFDMQPFSINTLKILLISSVSFLTVYFIPLPFSALVCIILRSVAFGGVFLLLILWFKPSEELDTLIKGSLAEKLGLR